jgi:hypothetical protein
MDAFFHPRRIRIQLSKESKGRKEVSRVETIFAYVKAEDMEAHQTCVTNNSPDKYRITLFFSPQFTSTALIMFIGIHN